MADRELSLDPGPAMSVGSQLCTQCGLCCTGALHDTASAEPGEVEGLRNRGMQIVKDEKFRFSLPCPQLKGTSCGIYENRPHVCSRYRCQLLRDVEAGAAEPADALLKVREARRLYEAVVRLMPPGMSLPQARALPRDPKSVPKGMNAAGYPVLILQVLTLMRYIDQHLRHSDEGPLLREEVLVMGELRERSHEVPQQHV